VWPLASQCRLVQNTVVGAMTLLLAMRGNMATRSMFSPPFSSQLHRTTVWCRATRTSRDHSKHFNERTRMCYHQTPPLARVVAPRGDAGQAKPHLEHNPLSLLGA